MDNNSSLKLRRIRFLNKDEELELFMGFRLKIQTNDEFIDAVIFNESIFIINEKQENLFALLKIMTEQFVKTKLEFEKFKKIIKK